MTGTAPGTPATGDVYLDDGTNTGSGDPSLKRWNGSAWVDIGGGTVSPLTTKGDVYTFDTDEARLPSSGVNGQVLKVNTATATGLEWGAASGYTPPVTTKGDLFGFDTAAAAVPVGTNGQVLTADSTDAQGVSWQSASSQALVKGEVPSGTKDSSNVTFTLATAPITGSLQLYINGIRLKLTDDYTITGGTITMGTAPNSGDILLADYATSTGTFSTGSTSFVYNQTPTGTIDGSNTAFDTASNFVAGSILVYLDGQLQKPGGSYDYVETDSNTITFNTAPVLGSVLLVSYQSAVSASGNADTVDGFNANSTPTASNIPVLDSNALLPQAIGAYTNSKFYQSLQNSNFDIWQRSTSTVLPGATNVYAYVADRFLEQSYAGTSGSGSFTTTVSRQAFTPGQTDVPNEPKYFHRYNLSVLATKGGGNAFLRTVQCNEGVNTFAGMPITISFYAKANSARTAEVLANQYFGTGGSPSSDVATVIGTFNMTTSWQKFTLTTTLPSISGKTLGTNANDFLMLGIYWYDEINSAGTFATGIFDLAQMQLNYGTKALPYQPKIYGQELADCQRCCFVPDGYSASNGPITGLGLAYSTTQCQCPVTFPVTMRTVPILIATASDWRVWNNSDGAQDATTMVLGEASTTMANVTVGVASGLTQQRSYYIIPDLSIPRYMIFSAEFI
jgi:hypothetical protein